MTSRSPVIVGVAIAMFGAGAAFIWLLRDTPDDFVSAPQRSDPGLGTDQSASRLDAIDRRLADIEASLLKLGETQKGSSEVSIPTRSDAPDLNQLRDDLQALRDELRARMAGLGELQARNPRPNVSALNELLTRTGGDARLVGDAIRGLTYRDLVLQFGSPTVKFAPLTGPKIIRAETWLWETSSGDLAVTFAQGAAIEASFHGSGVMRKFLEDSNQ